MESSHCLPKMMLIIDNDNGKNSSITIIPCVIMGTVKLQNTGERDADTEGKSSVFYS